MGNMQVVIGRPTYTWDKLKVMNEAGCCAECGGYTKDYKRTRIGTYWYCPDCAKARREELAFLEKN